MRIRTHAFFGFGIEMLLLSWFKPAYLPELDKAFSLPTFAYDWLIADIVIAYVISLVINTSIDAAGHRMLGPTIRRRWQTHNVVTAPLRGAGFCLAAVATPSWLLGLAFPSEWILALWVSIMGATIGITHLFLDAFTPDGIFLTEHRKLHLGRVNGNGSALNWAIIVVGIAIAIASVLLLDLHLIII